MPTSVLNGKHGDPSYPSWGVGGVLLSNRLEPLGKTMKPEWIDEEAWNGFVEMRKSIKKPLSERATNRLINRLALLKQKGHDPDECLDQSTFYLWQDVYPVKNESIPDLRPAPSYEGPKLTKEEIEAAKENKAKVLELVKTAFRGKVA